MLSVAFSFFKEIFLFTLGNYRDDENLNITKYKCI